MKPIYIKNYVYNIEPEAKLFDIYEILRTQVAWVNRDAPRDECFMALEDATYTYGKSGFARTYNSVPFHISVQAIMNRLNKDNNSKYNVCFLNYYKDEKQHLGWHSDDSPEMDINHPIAVVSFGAERYIWTKHKDAKGEVPEEDRYLLTDGSLFIMPEGYQKDYMHRIPKNDRPCGGRISLTFRKFMNKENK